MKVVKDERHVIAMVVSLSAISWELNLLSPFL